MSSVNPSVWRSAHFTCWPPPRRRPSNPEPHSIWRTSRYGANSDRCRWRCWRPHARSKDGKDHTYWSLVETLRTADGPRQKTLCYLGELNSPRRRAG